MELENRIRISRSCYPLKIKFHFSAWSENSATSWGDEISFDRLREEATRVLRVGGKKRNYEKCPWVGATSTTYDYFRSVREEDRTQLRTLGQRAVESAGRHHDKTYSRQNASDHVNWDMHVRCNRRRNT